MPECVLTSFSPVFQNMVAETKGKYIAAVLFEILVKSPVRIPIVEADSLTLNRVMKLLLEGELVIEENRIASV